MLCRVFLPVDREGLFDDFNRTGEGAGVEDVGDTDFVFAMVFREVKAICGGEHDRFAPVAEIREQPLGKGFCIFDRKFSNTVEGSFRLLHEDPWDFLQSPNENIPSFLVLAVDFGKVAGLGFEGFYSCVLFD